MESVTLLGVFIAIAIIGYLFTGKVDKFLSYIQEDNEKQKQIYNLRIAASDFCVAYSISDVLSDMRKEYPDLYCTLSVGKEDELLQFFENNKADVIIVSSDIEYPEYPFKNISIEVHPFKLDEQTVILTPLTTGIQKRKIFWQNSKSQPLVLELVKHLSQSQL